MLSCVSRGAGQRGDEADKAGRHHARARLCSLSPVLCAPLPVGVAFELAWLVWTRWARFLALRTTRSEFARLTWREHLGPALILSWVVGMGRYWDHPTAPWQQMLGIGSVIYVWALAALLWLVVKPLRPVSWGYLDVVTVVAMSSPPGLLYAIPIEKWTSIETAIMANVWALAGVALWRVLILFMCLRRMAQLTWPRTLVAALLPLSGIVAALAVLNLEHAVFRIMSGLRHIPTPYDGAYAVVVFLTFLAFWLFVPLVLAYLTLVILIRRRGQAEAHATGA